MLKQILTLDTGANRSDALEIALGDPDAALACFRGAAVNHGAEERF
jgi:hypothetical protein